jgi:hypothetical protein
VRVSSSNPVNRMLITSRLPLESIGERILEKTVLGALQSDNSDPFGGMSEVQVLVELL